jgi:peroxiredoxin
MVEDLHHSLFECKTLRCIRRELVEEIETVVQSFFSDLAFSDLQSFQKLQFLIGDFCFSFNTELGFLLDQLSQKLLGKMIKEWAILIESCVVDQELA